MDNKKVPKLRFSEFKEAWKSTSLDEEAKFHDSERIPLSQDDRQKRKGVYPYYGASGIIDYIDDYIFDGEYILLGEDGANILTRSSPLAFVVKGKIWVNNHAHVLQSKTSNKFLAESLERINYEKYNTGTAQPKLNAEVCKNIRFNIPKENEQQKIADFLSSVDEKIQQLRQKKELLEAYKKGVMQKLFPSADAQAPEIRFKDEDGADFPDWEYKELGEISDRITDKNEDEEYDFVLTNSAVQGVVSQTDYFDKQIANKKNLGGYYIVKKNDFVYNPRISNEAPVGPIKRNKLKTGVMSPLYNVFRMKEENIDYFEYFFETAHWHRYMHSVANIGARHDRMNITVGDFKKLPIPVPSVKERERITDFINSVSDKLAAVNQTLEFAEKFKKGLLQQMFV